MSQMGQIKPFIRHSAGTELDSKPSREIGQQRQAGEKAGDRKAD